MTSARDDDAAATAQTTRKRRGDKVKIKIAIAATALLLAVSAANAQSDYPGKPVKIVVNVAAGGGVDTATRIVAQRLSEKLGQTFVI